MRNQSGKWKVESGKGTRSLCARTVPLSPFPFRLSPSPFPPRRGITLIEVLISMFVLLFGLMGVAAIFPVASHYILEGDKRDRSSGLAQLAFEELKARKILKPREWMYANHPDIGSWVIDRRTIPTAKPGEFYTQPVPAQTPGHAFVIDPLGGAQITVSGLQRMFFPASGSMVTRPWPTLRFPTISGTYVTPSAGSLWPIYRISLPIPTSNTAISTFPYVAMDRQTADMAFRLRDDLAIVQPDAGDRPSIQRWRTNGTQLLSRDYVGDYSWLATVVPTSQRALIGLQPAANIKDAFYEVTTVVFYKRDVVPSTSAVGSPGSERLITAQFLNESELAIYSTTNTDAEINLAIDGIKPTNWIAVMGVNQITGAFMMKWYKIQAMDDENSAIVADASTPANGRRGRYLMVQGPDWPTSSYNNLRVAILPGAIDAYTRVMQVDVE